MVARHGMSFQNKAKFTPKFQIQRFVFQEESNNINRHYNPFRGDIFWL